MEEVVKIKLDDEYPYSDFEGWYGSLDFDEKNHWKDLSNDIDKSEANAERLTKKAIELYCLEMDIDYIPKNEDYLDTIFKKFRTNLTVASLRDKGMVTVNGNLSFIGDVSYSVTDKGRNYLKHIK